MRAGVEAASLSLLLCGGMLLSYLTLTTDTETQREEADLVRVVRSLSAIQQKNEAVLSRLEKEALSVVTKKFPWLPKNNTLPNYLLNSGSHTDNDYKYRDANIAFIHYPRAGGYRVIECLREISIKKHIAMSPLMTSKNRLLWERGEDNLEKFRNRLKFHSGRYVFGVCEKVNSPCSYFLLLREPMQQAISSYEYCKETYEDEICQGFNANKMTLREWILSQGSVLFRQLMLNINFCASDHTFNFNLTLPEGFLFDKKDMPCWMKQKIFLDKLSSTDLSHAVNYIISHLQSWFAVIGLLDDPQGSLEVFEKVYKLPFTKCKHFDRKETLSEPHHASFDNSANSVYQRQSDIYDENDPYTLSDDVYVRKALSADYRIYKAALKIYHMQKQTLSNRIWR
ncbi:uncharacterized protein LOC124131603 [Haliotis rufescens]|uniref:uncharacterized protein LOC124131603 n=1 Tax=Haliotis rufescens TaxID=6454 RepID=UPI00201E7DE0|nr:uncharacterized protein LOC124131603 [Haliotis rufescens]